MNLFTPILMAHKAWHRAYKKVALWYWQQYAIAYLLYRGRIRCDSRFYGHCIILIAKGATVDIGTQFTCRSGMEQAIDNGMGSKIVVHSGGHLQIGAHSGMSNTVINCSDHITIGNYVNIGAGCMIMDSNFHSTDWRIRMTSEDTTLAKTSPVTIGDGVFIGARSIICKGVTIGEHSMIAAGSVVVSDIPANCMAGGNPCKVIRKLEQ